MSQRASFLTLALLTLAGCGNSGRDNTGSGGSVTGTGGSSAGSNASASGSGGVPTTNGGSAGTTTGGQGVPPTGGASGAATGGGGAGPTGGAGGAGGTTTGGGGGAGGAAPGGLSPAGNTCPAGPFARPITGNVKAEVVRANLGGELEGPVWVESEQVLLFTQSGGGNANGKINRYKPVGDKLDTFVSNVGVGGLAIDNTGMLLAASYDKRSITRFDPKTAARSDVPGGSMFEGKLFNEVNDVVVRSDGNVYFSDPQYDTMPPGKEPMAWYRLSPAPESKVTRLLESNGANGIALSLDGRMLYLGTTEAGGGPVRHVALNADGSMSGQPTNWNEGSSDGMAMDCAGNLYITIDNQIRVLSPTDEVLGNVTGLGNGYVTNSAFGDADHQTLYITTDTTLYKIHLAVPGFPN